MLEKMSEEITREKVALEDEKQELRIDKEELERMRADIERKKEDIDHLRFGMLEKSEAEMVLQQSDVDAVKSLTDKEMSDPDLKSFLMVQMLEIDLKDALEIDVESQKSDLPEVEDLLHKQDILLEKCIEDEKDKLEQMRAELQSEAEHIEKEKQDMQYERQKLEEMSAQLQEERRNLESL